MTAARRARRTRPSTPIHRNADGSRTVRVQRSCDGCGLPVGNATDAELATAIAGRDLPSVAAEHGCQIQTQPTQPGRR